MLNRINKPHISFREPLCEIFMDRPSRDSYSVTNFLEWRESDTLVISPKFQRRSVWRLPQRSYLIDTLLRQMPVPPIYLRNVYDSGKQKVIREVIDGQQRMRSVLDYVDGKYALSKSLNSPYKGTRFSGLPEDEQTAIRKYRFNCETFDDISDRDVLEVFSRLNMYSIPLNKQELRNGKFFGPFKQLCYDLAHSHLELWRQWRVFAESKIARMAEVQLTSAILIAAIDGLQNKNDSIDDFYAEYEDVFPDKDRLSSRFCSVMDELTETFETLADSPFRSQPLFYSLFCTVYHRCWGLPKFRLRTPKKKRLTLSDRDGLKGAVDKLSSVVSMARKEQRIARRQDSPAQSSRRTRVPTKYRDFAAACLSGTDSMSHREQRLKTLYTEAF